MGKWHYSKKSSIWCYVDILFNLEKDECLKHIFYQFKNAKSGLTCFSNYDSKDYKNTQLHV